MTTPVANLRLGAPYSSSVDKRTMGPVNMIVIVLICEQVLTGAVGIAGGLLPQDASAMLVGLIIGQLILDGVAILFLLFQSGLRPSGPRTFTWCLGVLVYAAVLKNIDVSPVSSTIDLIRLIVPLLWVALTPDGIGEEFVRSVTKWRMLVIVILAIEVAGLAAGRLAGWGGGYLSGDPLVGFVVFPSIVVGGLSAGSAMAGILVPPLVLGSLKRTAWLSVGVVLLLLALGALRGVSRATVSRGLIMGIIGLTAVLALTQLRDSGNQITVRAQSIVSSLTEPASDESFGQRIDEVSFELTRAQAAPVQSVVFGLSSGAIYLPNGISTHAIHNTLVFLLFGGGLIWLIALSAATRRTVAKSSPESWLVAVVGIGTLVDSLGGNTALAPSFGFALAVTLNQLRRMLASRGSHAEA